MPQRQSLAVNLGLALVVSVLFLGTLEGVCLLMERRQPPAEVADYIWNWDTRWDSDFYTVTSDAVGWPPGEEFNGDGLRDRAHRVEKEEGRWRVVCLGDSVTMGAGIKPEQAYPQALEARFDANGSRVEVMNVALWGWSTRQQVIAYKTIARDYKPDQVILGVCLNDIPELQNNLTRPPRWLQALHERSALARRIVNARSREIGSVEELLRDKDSPKVKEAFVRFFGEVRTLRAEVEKDGATLSVVVFPFRFQVTPAAPPPAAQEAIAKFCTAEGLRCFDLLPALRATGEAAFVDYDHLSPSGAGVVVDAVVAAGIVRERKSDAQVLAEAGIDRETAALLRALAHRDPDVRAAAAWALSREGADSGTPASTATAALAMALKDPTEAVRTGAARALTAQGAAARAAIPALFAALDDPRESVRAAAALALWKIGVTRPEWINLVAGALRNEDPYVRGFAAWTLGEIGPAAAEAVPALVEALARDEAYGRGGAAAALAKMGPYAAPAVAALMRGLESPDARARWSAARTLGRIGPQAATAVVPLTTALGDGDERVRAHAARALGKIGPAAAPALSALEAASHDRERSVRKEARQALAAIGRR